MHVVRNLDIGGAQEVVRTLVEYLAQSGCKPIVCALEDGPMRQEIEKSGIKVELFKGRTKTLAHGPGLVLDLLRVRRDLAELVQKYQIEVVQTHLVFPIDLLLLTLLENTSLKTVIWTFHSANPMSKRSKLRKAFCGQAYRLGTRRLGQLVSVSDKVEKATLEQIGPVQNKTAIIHNGVDLRRYGNPVGRLAVRKSLGLGADAQVAITVGTLLRAKGHRFLIKAAAILVPQHPNLHFLFAGDGELGDELRAQARSLSVQDNIHFLGNRSDVPALLAASDLFVLPSLWEGLSMALLEAMASRKPIVATIVSGTQYVLADGKTGLLVPPGDPEALAQAIAHVLADPQHAQAMAAAAQEHVEREFSAQKQADEHIALYTRLLNRTA